MGFPWFSRKKNEPVPDPDLAAARRRVEEIVERSDKVVEFAVARRRRNNFTELAAHIFRGD